MTSDATPRPPRTWQEIARELAQETDRNRVGELAEELNQAFGEEELPATKATPKTPRPTSATRISGAQDYLPDPERRCQ